MAEGGGIRVIHRDDKCSVNLLSLCGQVQTVPCHLDKLTLGRPNNELNFVVCAWFEIKELNVSQRRL